MVKNVRTKMKTHKGIAKRYKVTGSGKKVLAMSCGKGHLMSSKNGKRVRQLRKRRVLDGQTIVGRKVLKMLA